MDKEYVLACLQDVLSAIEDVEKVFADFPKRYDAFADSILHISLVERKTEIMGEALSRIRRIAPEFSVPKGREIIATRNRIVHSYDNVRPEFLWGLVLKHIPELKTDIERLINELDN